MDDGRELPGELYTHHRVGDVHSLIFTFGSEQIQHPENGRLHLSLMPLEFVRFSNFAIDKGQRTTPKIEVLSHEQYRAMLQKRSSSSGRPAAEGGADPSP